VVSALCRYQGAYDVSALDGRGPLTLDRWIVDPAAGKVTEQRLDDRLQEFPRVDDRVISRPPGTSPATRPPGCTCPPGSRSGSAAAGSPTARPAAAGPRPPGQGARP